MRCSCYEIGGDVFSLAELECIVIRGKMSQGINTKPPFVEPPKASGAYSSYALSFIDPRVNFILVSSMVAMISIFAELIIV